VAGRISYIAATDSPSATRRGGKPALAIVHVSRRPARVPASGHALRPPSRAPYRPHVSSYQVGAGARESEAEKLTCCEALHQVIETPVKTSFRRRSS
jgi:hypothetical protein